MKPRGKVFIVSGHLSEAESLAGYLRELHCEVEVASPGSEILAKIAHYQPGVIILDCELSGVSGFDICRLLKSEPKTQKTMVFMITALNEVGDIERAVAAGADDFLSKPVNKIELVKRVENLLKIRRIRDQE